MLAEYISIAFGFIFISNVLLSQFLGICSFIGVSTKRSNAIGMSLSVIGVMLIAAIVSWVIYNLILVPLDIAFLYLIVFILVIAFLVQLLEMILKKYIPGLYKSLGIYLPLITTNCAILGVAVNATTKLNYNFGETVVYALAIGVGYLLVMVMFSSIRERIASYPIPKPFKGVAIALIIAGMMALAFKGLAGVI
ncbi:MAG: Rnf-Nqr domain containing protein [Bacilli bacterium]|nr:Rnf-Nqr domain containing protein [Bacilli bacterium]MDD4066262.1 Rnf-Nqr domain containing protein [Bacilli bacterium]